MAGFTVIDRLIFVLAGEMNCGVETIGLYKQWCKQLPTKTYAWRVMDDDGGQRSMIWSPHNTRLKRWWRDNGGDDTLNTYNNCLEEEWTARWQHANDKIFSGTQLTFRGILLCVRSCSRFITKGKLCGHSMWCYSVPPVMRKDGSRHGFSNI